MYPIDMITLVAMVATVAVVSFVTDATVSSVLKTESAKRGCCCSIVSQWSLAGTKVEIPTKSFPYYFQS